MSPPPPRELGLRPGQRRIKRGLDLLFCILLGVPAIPVVLVGAILVRLTMAGPAFYSQTRVTRGGRVFRIWKLRTMILDAEPGGVAVWPEERDSRITGLGRVMRRLWVDELPQLWNVLRGDMSVVGPRPERPEFVESFAKTLPRYRDRHAVPAGITGLAQVRGLTGNTSIRRRLALDLVYVRSWTPGLDVWILARTAGQVLQRAFGRKTRQSKERSTAASGVEGS